MDQIPKVKIRRTDQISELKISSFMEQINNNREINSFHQKLLETSFILKTIDIMIIANHLKYSPATIYTGYQYIYKILGESGREHLLQIIKNQTLQDTQYTSEVKNYNLPPLV